jgi:lipid II:glycine glycyltransferase (peptidoglycan interpeptide bridge formation enzyme)
VIAARSLTTPDRDAWDALVAARPASGFMQSWAWSEFKALEGYQVTRLGLFDGGRLRGGALVYTYPSPLEAGLAVVPDGPVLDWDDPAAATALRTLVAAFRATPAGRRVVALRVEPRLPSVPAVLGSLGRAPVDLVPDETWEVDLGPEPEMLARMRPKGRYNARLAFRRGIEVSSSSEPSDVHELYFVLEHTARYQDFLLEPKSFFINLVRTLAPGMARLGFARYRGMTLAAALTVRHGPVVTYLYGGRLPLFRHLMPSAALHWHLMREAAAEGYRVYDLYGYVGPGRLEHRYDRFSRFKEKLGGRPVVRMGSRDLVFHDRLADAALRALRAVGLVPARAVAGEGASRARAEAMR